MILEFIHMTWSNDPRQLSYSSCTEELLKNATHHNAIIVEFAFNHIERNPGEEITYLDFHNANYNEINEALLLKDWDVIFENKISNDLYRLIL